MSLILSPDMTQGRPARRPRTPFGERLAQARERAGLTQVQLAEKLGTTQGNVTSWEREVVALRPEQLNALADVLDVSADYLLGRKNGKHVTPKRPIAKVQQIFERVNKLPRHQQSKVAEFVEAYVNQYTSKVS
ncbi:MAG TPA: helix-turn-helix transcriptional regulator [Tepidisphaeraceae bacterium]|nr:helix-turn-helix transcriptional regulator [Tepidisphaeraceae bacterium]